MIGGFSLRETIQPYVYELGVNASAHGAPTMRALFYDFPADNTAWAIDDQYMFGPLYVGTSCMITIVVENVCCIVREK